jgi:membrane-associated phospholipid phosphatase
MDAALGFDWLGFLKLTNANELVSHILLACYQYTGLIVFVTMLWLCLSNNGARLAEFLALLCLTAIGTAIGMLVLPAASGYSLHQPSPAMFSHFGPGTGLLHYDLLMQFRSATPPAIDFDLPYINCLVAFPSGHTILALVTTYALRDRLFTLIPALAVNGVMIVSTIPVGGHYLVDLIASGVITALSIAILRRPGDSKYRGLARRKGEWVTS